MGFFMVQFSIPPWAWQVSAEIVVMVPVRLERDPVVMPRRGLIPVRPQARF